MFRQFQIWEFQSITSRMIFYSTNSEWGQPDSSPLHFWSPCCSASFHRTNVKATQSAAWYHSSNVSQHNNALNYENTHLQCKCMHQKHVLWSSSQTTEDINLTAETCDCEGLTTQTDGRNREKGNEWLFVWCTFLSLTEQPWYWGKKLFGQLFMLQCFYGKMLGGGWIICCLSHRHRWELKSLWLFKKGADAM